MFFYGVSVSGILGSGLVQKTQDTVRITLIEFQVMERCFFAHKLGVY